MTRGNVCKRFYGPVICTKGGKRFYGIGGRVKNETFRRGRVSIKRFYVSILDVPVETFYTRRNVWDSTFLRVGDLSGRFYGEGG